MALVGAQFVNAVSPNPVGSLQAYAGASAPTGWLLCDGSAVSRTVYPELFSVLGTTYGAGDGSTTFGLPDLRGRMPIGAGNDGTAANNATRTRGDKGGDTRLQSHTHDIQRNNVAASSTGTDTSTVYRTLAGTGATYTTTQSNGSGSGENMPPFLVTNYIIKAVSDAPRSGLAYGSTPPIVTALPTNPQFGDVVTYIADAANGVAWNLQYDATGTYPWKFIGGSSLSNSATGSVSSSASALTALSGGPSLTVPLAGDYFMSFSAIVTTPTNNWTMATVSVCIAGSATSILAMAQGGLYDNGGVGRAGVFSMTNEGVATVTTAGTLVDLRYQNSNNSNAMSYSHRNLNITPVRVKAA